MVELSTGLLLEDLGLVIPWGITIDEAWRAGSPKPWNLPEDRQRMKWEPATILGGLQCMVQTYFPSPSARLSVFNILDAHYEAHSPEDWAQTLRAHCRRLFGSPGSDKSWRADGAILSIHHDDRFVEAYWLEIRRERG